jgi:hypothetical protein
MIPRRRSFSCRVVKCEFTLQTKSSTEWICIKSKVRKKVLDGDEVLKSFEWSLNEVFSTEKQMKSLERYDILLKLLIKISLHNRSVHFALLHLREHFNRATVQSEIPLNRITLLWLHHAIRIPSFQTCYIWIIERAKLLHSLFIENWDFLGQILNRFIVRWTLDASDSSDSFLWGKKVAEEYLYSLFVSNKQKICWLRMMKE